MYVKNSMSADEFQRLNKQGVFKAGKRGRVSMQELLPEYKELVKQDVFTYDDITICHIKPISVNEAFKGRRFHTEAHKLWKMKVMNMLPHIILPQPPYEIYLKFGFSSTASDWDNPIKQVQDSLAEKYGFNDKLIRKGVIETDIVPKGQEYFAFKLSHYNKK